MLKNYFKTALRTLMRYKSYSIINIAGLSIGMAACLLLFLVIRYELSYDTFQPNYKSIYNVATRDDHADGVDYTPGIPYVAVDALRIDLPQLKTGSLFCHFNCQVSTTGNSATEKKFIEDMGMYFFDPEFFEIFHYKWLIGNEKIMAEPNNIALTKSTAEKYFGDWKTAVGKFLKLDNALTMSVAGILEDAPANSDFQIHLAGSLITIKDNPVYSYNTDWGSTTSNYQAYVLLPSAIKRSDVDAQLKIFCKKHYKSNSNGVRTHVLRPLSNIHFDKELGNFGTHSTSRSSLLVLSFIGFLIILMACINFINLSTAQAVMRSKEVGVRKVLGGNRVQLFGQMLGETALVVFVAALLSLIIAKFASPYIRHIISIEEELNILTSQSLLFFILVSVSVILLAGIYPALILSGFKPVTALKNKMTSTKVGNISLRRVLVVLQFSISQLLIIGTIVAISQMDFIRSADLGFNKDATLILSGNDDSLSLTKQSAFKEQLLQIPGVQSVSFNSDAPSSDYNAGTNFAFNHRPDEKFTLYLKLADENYFKTFGLQFITGEGYEKNDGAKKVVVNETLLKKLNIKNASDAVGKEIRVGSGKWKIICGVVKDFKTNSLREEVKPTVILPLKIHYHITAIKLRTLDLSNTVDAVQRSWDKFYPEYVFSSTFMDETINKFYEQEKQTALLYKIFSAIAIFISCLGLYGLISFMSVQRTKEIGIRKVLGAGVTSSVLLFSKEFTILIGVAFLIAAPLAYYFMTQWLQNFVYRTNIGFSVFVIALVTSFAIAWLTVGYKAIRAALANPVKSLRTNS